MLIEDKQYEQEVLFSYAIKLTNEQMKLFCLIVMF